MASRQTVSKTQAVRIMDVLLLGPAMILGARQIESPVLKVIVGVGGAATIGYNLTNYLNVRRRQRRERRGD